MLRRTTLTRLKTRPKTAKVEVGSARTLDEPILSKAKEMFAHPEFPNKKVIHNWRFFVRAGKCATGPPVGQEFSKMGLKVMDFTKAFNDRTKPVFKDDVDLIVRIQVFFDKSYNYRMEPPPTTWFILKALRLKRRETGPVMRAGSFCALITLEMIYEIARMKQFNWSKPEFPPIEARARSIVGQCRRMGIAIIGVDCPSSPVKGMTQQQYEQESEKYRALQMEQYEALKDQQLQEAPLIERLHAPNLNVLTYDQIKEGLLDPKLFSNLWKATDRVSYYTDREREKAQMALVHKKWMRKDMSLAEGKSLFANWRLPALEQKRQEAIGQSQSAPQYWTRDDARSGK